MSSVALALSVSDRVTMASSTGSPVTISCQRGLGALSPSEFTCRPRDVGDRQHPAADAARALKHRKRLFSARPMAHRPKLMRDSVAHLGDATARDDHGDAHLRSLHHHLAGEPTGGVKH